MQCVANLAAKKQKNKPHGCVFCFDLALLFEVLKDSPTQTTSVVRPCLCNDSGVWFDVVVVFVAFTAIA